MPFVKVPQESFEIALMLGCCLVIGFFEFGIADEGFAMFAPVFRLCKDSKYKHSCGVFDLYVPLTSNTLTSLGSTCGSGSVTLEEQNRRY